MKLIDLWFGGPLAGGLSTTGARGAPKTRTPESGSNSGSAEEKAVGKDKKKEDKEEEKAEEKSPKRRRRHRSHSRRRRRSVRSQSKNERPRSSPQHRDKSPNRSKREVKEEAKLPGESTVQGSEERVGRKAPAATPSSARPLAEPGSAADSRAGGKRRSEESQSEEEPSEGGEAPPGRWTLREGPSEPRGAWSFRPPEPAHPPPGWRPDYVKKRSKGINRDLRNQDIFLHGPDPARKRLREESWRR